MDPREATNRLEKTAFNLKTFEQCKVLIFRRILETAPSAQVYSSAAFLHEELVKLPMFPRKALEADFNLFPKLADRELLTTDMLHKNSWCQLIWSLFSAMECKTASIWDITLFINVINGSFILHCDDLNIIRTCLAIYISAARHFQHIFSTNGFLLIIPTLMKVYSNMQANPIIKNAIEFACLQFYVMHRVPFVLQLFGSVAQILDLKTLNIISTSSNKIDTNKVHSSCLFNLILSMEEGVNDNLNILEIVRKLSGESEIPLTTVTTGTGNNNIGNVISTSSNKNINGQQTNDDNNDDGSLNNPETSEFSSSLTTGTTGYNNYSGYGSFPRHQTTTPYGLTKPNLLTSKSDYNIPVPINPYHQQRTTKNLPLGQSINNQTSSSVGSTTNATTALAVSGITTSSILIAPNSTVINQLSSPTLQMKANDANKTSNQVGVSLSNHTLTSQQQQQQQSIVVTSKSQQLQNPINNTLDQRSMIKVLDFCYSDDLNARFSIIETINLCVTVIAYATQAYRANQMLIILDIVIPRYTQHLKTETDKFTLSGGLTMTVNQDGQHHARNELANIQRIAIAIKTLINTTDFLSRTYGSTNNETTNLKMNSDHYIKKKRSPSIQADEDSMRFHEDRKQKGDNQQRNTSQGQEADDFSLLTKEFR
jgi:hypothetical protein